MNTSWRRIYIFNTMDSTIQRDNQGVYNQIDHVPFEPFFRKKQKKQIKKKKTKQTNKFTRFCFVCFHKIVAKNSYLSVLLKRLHNCSKIAIILHN